MKDKKLPTLTTYVSGGPEMYEFIKKALEMEGHILWSRDMGEFKVGKRSRMIMHILERFLIQEGYFNEDGTPNEQVYATKKEEFTKRLRTPIMKKR